MDHALALMKDCRHNSKIAIASCFLKIRILAIACLVGKTAVWKDFVTFRFLSWGFVMQIADLEFF